MLSCKFGNVPKVSLIHDRVQTTKEAYAFQKFALFSQSASLDYFLLLKRNNPEHLWWTADKICRF